MSDLDDVTLVSTGLPMAFFNGAFVRRAPSDPEAAIEATLEFFSGRDVPYLLWAREAIGGEILSAGRAAGLRDAGGVPGMGLPVIGEIPRPPGELELRLVSTAADFDEHCVLMSKGFGAPVEVFRQVLVPSVLGDPLMAAAIGSVDGVGVATAFVVTSGDTAGVYDVATVPEQRGKGYGAAATWAVVAEAARRGCTHSVLQSSQKGYSVHQRMGYMDLGRYLQLEGPPGPPPRRLRAEGSSKRFRRTAASSAPPGSPR